MSLNRIAIIGHLGQDPELRYLSTSGQPVTGFSVATAENFTGKDGNRQERVQWHNIVVFGKLAETCTKYLGKGRQVYVEGRFRTRDFEDKNGGGKRASEPKSWRSACNSSERGLKRLLVARPRSQRRAKRHPSEWLSMGGLMPAQNGDGGCQCDFLRTMACSTKKRGR
jgi:single-strand DNA-binding protein